MISIDAKWTLRENVYMAHMTPQATNGLDMYVKLDGKWQWCGIGKPSHTGLEQHAMIKEGFLPTRTYECIVYLPLYSGIASLQLGFSPQAKVTGKASLAKPIVMYGTSILHGCSASRTGMTFGAMLGRSFEMPVVNLGFSGNGLMENYFADILSEIDASVYVLDCLPNMHSLPAGEVYQRVKYLVTQLRKRHADTPIVLVEDRSYAHPNLTGKPIEYKQRKEQLKAYQELKSTISQLYYVEGNQLLGDDNEATVDGSHPSDLGMMRYFEVLKPVIAKALKKSIKD